MTDLLGDPAPDPPPMNAPLLWAVFQVGESEWYVARTIDEAKQAAASDWGMTVAECEADDMFDEAHELNAGEMETMKFRDDDAPGRPVTTFREELATRCAGGITEPGLFAASDY